MEFSFKDPVTILNAATGTGAGAGYDCAIPYRTFTFHKSVTGTFAALVVAYEGSLDGTSWLQLGTDNTTTAAATFVVDKPVRRVRANVTTFTDGTTVTVKVLAVR